MLELHLRHTMHHPLTQVPIHTFGMELSSVLLPCHLMTDLV